MAVLGVALNNIPEHILDIFTNIKNLFPNKMIIDGNNLFMDKSGSDPAPGNNPGGSGNVQAGSGSDSGNVQASSSSGNVQGNNQPSEGDQSLPINPKVRELYNEMYRRVTVELERRTSVGAKSNSVTIRDIGFSTKDPETRDYLKTLEKFLEKNPDLKGNYYTPSGRRQLALTINSELTMRLYNCRDPSI